MQNLEYHQKRLERSQYELFFLKSSTIKLNKDIELPDSCLRGKYKCRIVYNTELVSVNFEEYHPPLIKSLQMVQADTVEYRFKYQNRTKLEELFRLRGLADDVLLVKSGYITDTSFANVCFLDEEKGWCTPKATLLEGTMRARLIQEGSVTQMDITPDMLSRFQKAALINAMLPPGEITLPVSKIYDLRNG